MKKVLIYSLIFLAGFMTCDVWFNSFITRNPVETTRQYNQCLHQYESIGRINEKTGRREATCEEQVKASTELANCLNKIFGQKAIWTTKAW